MKFSASINSKCWKHARQLAIEHKEKETEDACGREDERWREATKKRYSFCDNEILSTVSACVRRRNRSATNTCVHGTSRTVTQARHRCIRHQTICQTHLHTHTSMRTCNTLGALGKLRLFGVGNILTWKYLEIKRCFSLSLASTKIARTQHTNTPTKIHQCTHKHTRTRAQTQCGLSLSRA